MSDTDNIFRGESSPTFSKRGVAAMCDELREELREKKWKKKHAKRRGKKFKKLKREIKQLRKQIRKTKKLSRTPKKQSSTKSRKNREPLWIELLKQSTPLLLEIGYRFLDRKFFPPSQITNPGRLIGKGRR